DRPSLWPRPSPWVAGARRSAAGRTECQRSQPPDRRRPAACYRTDSPRTPGRHPRRGRGPAGQRNVACPVMEFGPEDRATLDRILRWRRDIRHFRPDPVPEPLLDELRAAMELAPSVGNSRPWRVVRVETPALRDRIRAEFQRCNTEAASHYRGQQRQEYDALKLAGLDRAPVWLAVFTRLDPSEGHGLGRATMPQTLQQSTAMAIMALWLAARARNLG